MAKQYARIPSLMDESPISFYPYLAKVLGVNEAIVLQQIWFFVNGNRNKQSKYHFRKGKWWVYNSYKEWCDEHFIWLKPRGLQGIILHLEKVGVLDTMQGVVSRHDRRKWYTVNLQKLEALIGDHLGHSADNAPYSAENVPSLDDFMHDVDEHEMYDEDTEIEKDTEKTTKKETTSAPNVAAHVPANEWPVEQEASFYLNGEKEYSSQAEKVGTDDADATTPPPTPPAINITLAPVADVQPPIDVVVKKTTRYTQEQARAMAVALGEAFGIPPANSEFGLYIKQAKELAKDVPVEDFKLYCDFRKKQAGDWADRLTIAQLLGKGHVSAYLQHRKIEAEKEAEHQKLIASIPPEYLPRVVPLEERASQEQIDAALAKFRTSLFTSSDAGEKIS